MAALGQADESEVETEETSDTSATASTASDEEGDSGQSEEASEETTEEGAESEEETEDTETVETKAEETTEDSPFTAADKAAIEKDPTLKKAYKGLMQSYTKKMQELGETAKFQKLLQGDPRTVLARVAEAHGLKAQFQDPNAQVAAAASSAAVASDPVQAAIEEVRASFAPLVGDETASQLVAGFNKIVSAATQTAVSPILQAQSAREQAQVIEQAKAEFSRFEKEHPDWKAHEAAMTELASRIQPKNMGAYEMSKFLYENVTRGQQIAKATTAAVAKVSAKVKKSVADSEPRPHTRVPGKSVKEAPRKYATPEDAVLASLAEMGYTE